MAALGLFEDMLSRSIAKVGVHYADDVVAKVLTHVDGIRQVFLSGKILPATEQFKRDGNVVFSLGQPLPSEPWWIGCNNDTEWIGAVINYSDLPSWVPLNAWDAYSSRFPFLMM
ncbi:MAG: hypothetical protein IPL72_06325 [Sulfuritalea sp.]|nr:hypothetical protein [Sulfuritalea sp.]